MLYEIFRPSKLKISLISIIILIFLTTVLVNIYQPKAKGQQLPTSIKEFTLKDGITLAGILLYLPISGMVRYLSKTIPAYEESLVLTTIFTLLLFVIIYYVLMSLIFYAVGKWFKDDNPDELPQSAS